MAKYSLLAFGLTSGGVEVPLQVDTDGTVKFDNGSPVNMANIKKYGVVLQGVKSGGGTVPLLVDANGNLQTSGGGGGDASGPASSTDNAIARFNGTGGKTLQNSGVTIDDNGVLALSSQIKYKPVTLTDAASISWALNNGNFATVTLTDNRAIAAATNQVNGGRYVLIVKQDATGSRTLSWNANYLFPGGTDPVLSTGANAIDIFEFVSDGTNMFGVASYSYA